MITIQMLEGTDLIESTDWCRPLQICSMSGGMSDGYSFKSMYSGCPENNVEWVQAKHVVGEHWFGKPVKEYNKSGCQYEFVRGDIPKGHRLDMSGYSSLSRSKVKRNYG